MTAHELLETLRAKGVQLTSKGDRLILDSPRGVLDHDRIEQVRALKSELLALLTEPDTQPQPTAANEDTSFLELLEAADRFQREGRPGPWEAFTMSADALECAIGDLSSDLSEDFELRLGIYRRDGLPEDHGRRIALFLIASEHDIPLDGT